MKTHFLGAACAGFFTLAVSISANAALIDRGGGLIYDDDRDITWLADANYAMTSGYDADGMMTWSEAMTWAGNLNYGGYTDWRLPDTWQPDPSCNIQGGVSLFMVPMAPAATAAKWGICSIASSVPRSVLPSPVAPTLIWPSSRTFS